MVLGLSATAQAATVQVEAWDDEASSPDASSTFTAAGVEINVPTSSDFAFGVFDVNKPLDLVRYIGWNFVDDPSDATNNDIAQYYGIDADGNGTEDGGFTGERVYGGSDVWLQSGASNQLKLAAPSCQGGDPAKITTLTSDELIASGDCTGGSGSAWHGNLFDWNANLPDAIVTQSGFQVFDMRVVGTLKSMDVGDTRYDFTDAAPPVARPSVLIKDASTTEGNRGIKQLSFKVNLNKTYTQPVNVDYTTANGSAKAGTDYVGETGTVTFQPGQRYKTVTIGIRGDRTRESSETFVVTLTNATNATISDPNGSGVIVNDDR